MNKKTNLLLILVLATLIRLFFVFNAPVRIDEQIMAGLIKEVSWQNIPVHHDIYSGENVTMTFLAMPLVKIFNFEPIVTFRFINLFFSIFFLILSFILVKLILNDKLATITTCLLAIWPWSIQAGSIGYNVFLLPFLYTAGLLLLYLALTKNNVWFYVASSFFWSISFYTYALSFAWVPLFLIIFFLIYRQDINSRFFSIFLFFLILLILPITIFYLKNEFNWSGPDQFLFFSLPDLVLTRFESISIFALYDGFAVLFNYIYNYLLHLVLFFLAYNPDKDFVFSYLTYIWDVIFILVGLVFCWKNLKSGKIYQLLFCWFLVYPLASSFVNAKAGFSFVRDIHALFLFAVLAAIGLEQILGTLRIGINSIKSFKAKKTNFS